MFQRIKCFLGFHDWEIIGWGNRYKKGKISRCKYCKKRNPLDLFVSDITKGINESDCVGSIR